MSRNYICTLNNADEKIEEPEKYLEALLAHPKVTYVTGQLEKGEANGVIHLQYFVHFSQPVRPTALDKEPFMQSHHEIARDPKKSMEYCQKTDTRIAGPWEFGEPFVKVGTGSRKPIMKDFIQGITRDQAEEMAPSTYLITSKAVAHFQQQFCQPFYGPRQSIWIYGNPGVGKSRYVKAMGPYIKASNKWWDGYAGQDDVLIDDIEKDSQFLGHFLKLWGDPYGNLDGEIKGGRAILCYKRLWITSNYAPSDIFTDEQLLMAIGRRFIILEMLAKPDVFGQTWIIRNPIQHGIEPSKTDIVPLDLSQRYPGMLPQ